MVGIAKGNFMITQNGHETNFTHTANEKFLNDLKARLSRDDLTKDQCRKLEWICKIAYQRMDLKRLKDGTL